MTDDDVLAASIDELVRNFRSALIAVLPAADRAMLTWTDDNQHFDWERLAQCMFDVFVRSPVSVDRHRVDGEFALAPYDIDVTSYAEQSWIACQVEPIRNLALVRFLTREQPFDTVQAVDVDPETYEAGERRSLPLTGTDFAYVRRGPHGLEDRVTRIEAVE